MNYLLDTCVISEFTKREPEPKVLHWLAEADETKLFLSVITLGEIRRGIERLPASPRKDQLSEWLNEELLLRFRDRVVMIDAAVMLLWGSLVAQLEESGRKMLAIDSLIAASALYHHLFLVTRNVADFAPAGVSLINPWD